MHQALFSQGLLFAEEKHDMEMKSWMEIQNKNRLIGYSICGFFILLLVIGWIYYCYRNSRLEYERQKLEKENLQIRLSQLEDESEKLKSLLAEQEELMGLHIVADDLRTQGFKQYLQGKLAYDGKLIEKSWSSVKNLVYSDMQGTTQESAETYFQTYMDSAEHAATRYIVAWDDTYALGVLEALEGANISESVKKTFLEGKPVMASVGGNEALSQVLSGTNPNYTNIASFEQIRSIQYSQNLLADALTAMCDYFAGQVVEQDQIQPIQWMN